MFLCGFTLIDWQKAQEHVFETEGRWHRRNRPATAKHSACLKEWIVAIRYRSMLTTRDSTATCSLFCCVQEIWGYANFTKPFGEVTTAPSLHWSNLIGYVIMSKGYRLRKWGGMVNMKQGVAKKGACMLFPCINRGGDALGMTNLKCFAYPVHPASYWFMVCLLYSMTSRGLMGYGQIWQKYIEVKEMKCTWEHWNVYLTSAPLANVYISIGKYHWNEAVPDLQPEMASAKKFSNVWS